MNLEIKAQIMRRGYRVKDVAAEANVTMGTASGVLCGRRTSRNVEEAVARMLGMDHSKLKKLWRKAA